MLLDPVFADFWSLGNPLFLAVFGLFLDPLLLSVLDYFWTLPLLISALGKTSISGSKEPHQVLHSFASVFLDLFVFYLSWDKFIYDGFRTCMCQISGTNYSTWAFQFELFLLGKDLWGHIDGTDAAPKDDKTKEPKDSLMGCA